MKAKKKPEGKRVASNDGLVRTRVYRCEFNFKGIKRCARSKDGIADFKDGFWVNYDFQFTKGSDYRYWIPPHAIEYIALDDT